MVFYAGVVISEVNLFLSAAVQVISQVCCIVQKFVIQYVSSEQLRSFQSCCRAKKKNVTGLVAHDRD